MTNAHWLDPCLLRVGSDFYCMKSSIEACTLMQVLHSTDLVNWQVISSVSRFLPSDVPSNMNWSPRICHINGKYRVVGHITGKGFKIWEAEKPEGPWQEIKHRFPVAKTSGMVAPNIFAYDDGTPYLTYLARIVVHIHHRIYLFSPKFVIKSELGVLIAVRMFFDVLFPHPTGSDANTL
jgi:beta-xylosidase